MPDARSTDRVLGTRTKGPFDEVVWERTTGEDGVTCMAPSKAAVDCLTGNGRMPAEGEALLAWMLENETQSRASSLTESDRREIA